MSFIYSRALVAASSLASYLDIAASVPSRESHLPKPSLWSDRTTVFFRLSRFGMMCAPLMAGRGGELLTWWLAGFPVKPIAPRLREEIMLTISGRKCGGSWQMSLPATYLPRTSTEVQSTARPMTSSRWVTKPEQFPLARRTWVVTMFGSGIGYLHTPTTKANYAAASMQKWPSARNFVTVFGRPTPENQEWLMGWPDGWTDTKPLETGKYLSWLQLHGKYSANKEAA